MRRALVVEDDPDIVELVTHYLAKEGWRVQALADGREALARVHAEGYDLIILDLQLPGMDGLALCREIRRDSRASLTPVVMLTARGDEADRIVGLEMGADDYVVKPFSPKELVARVRALFRRLERPAGSEEILSFGPVEVDRERHTVHAGRQPIRLTPKEFALLVALLEEVWGYSYSEGTRTVDVHVRRLREKIPALAPFILTVKSVGYRLSADPEG